MSSSKKGCGGGIVVTTPEGFKLYHALVFKLNVTNNEAEYDALIGGIKFTNPLKAERLRVKKNSTLVVGQVNGVLEVKGKRFL